MTPSPIGRPSDALGRLVAVSPSWQQGLPTPVSWPVQLATWAAAALTTVVVLLTGSVGDDVGPAGAIATVGGHPGIVQATGVVALVALGVLGVATGGFRRATLVWLRLWRAVLGLAGLVCTPAGVALAVSALLLALLLAACVAAVALLLALWAG